jgi:hypothetical protein
MPAYISSHFVTGGLTRTDTSPVVPVGTRVNLSDGGMAIYVQAASEISTYAAAVLLPDYTALMATTARVTDGTGEGVQIGWAQTSIASAYYGWLQVSGRPIANLAANCADKVALFTTATAGVMDDAVVSIGYAPGVWAITTISNATAVTLMVANPAFITNFAVQA